MARKDSITKKGPVFGNSRSHSKTITKRRWNLNLQQANVKTSNGKTKKVKVSAKTIRTLKKQDRLA